MAVANANHLLTKANLGKFVPLNGLSDESFDKLLANCRVEELAAGRVLFSQGEKDLKTIYLLQGSVELDFANGDVTKVDAGTAQSFHPLAHAQPRKASAIAISDICYVWLDNELLDVLLTWEQSAGYVVEEISPDSQLEDDADWMTRMLQSAIFFKVPPANIQSIFTKMSPVYKEAGDAVISQGEPGDYFYIIKQGKAEVIRRSGGAGASEMKLAEIGPGDGFGEEALISDSPRNATVRMTTKGELMRLSKPDFDELLKAPVLDEVTYEEAQAMMKEGALLVDVRMESEFANEHLPEASNVPLYMLRVKVKRVPEDSTIIVYCDSGSRSAAAAFVLSEAGYDVYLLQGGMMAANH